MRQTTFTVNASSVQGNPDAEVTFRHVTIGERQEYLESVDVTDIDMLRAHIVRWSGIVDDSGAELPSPHDEPDVINALYMPEMRALSKLLWTGPLEDSPKN